MKRTLNIKPHLGIIAIVFVLVVISGVMLFSYSNYKRNNTVEQSDLFPPVPEQVVLMVRAHALNPLFKVFDALAKQSTHSTKVFENAKAQFACLDSLVAKYSQLKNRIFNQPILVSWHLQGESNLKMFSVIHFSTIKEKDLVANIVDKEIGLSDRRKFNGTTIYHFRAGGDLYIAFWKHYALMGESSLIVEQSILKLNSGDSMSFGDGFSKVLHSAGEDAQVNLFVNFPNLQKVLNRNTLPAALFGQVFKWGDWGEYDVNFKEKGISLSGFSTYTNSHLVQMLKGQKPKVSTAMNFLPSNVDCFLSFPVNNYKLYLDTYKKRLDLNGGALAYRNQLVQFKRTLSVSSESFIETHFAGEVCFSLLERSIGAVDDDKVMVMTLKSGNLVTDLLQKAMHSTPQGKEYDIVIDNDSKYSAYQLGKLDIFGTLWGDLFTVKDGSLYVVFNNMLLCSSNKEKLKQFIYQSTLKKTFELSRIYDAQKENLSQSANLFMYAKGVKSKQLLNDAFMTDFSKAIEQKNDLSNTFGGVSVVVDLNSEMAYSSSFFDYIESNMQEAQTVWQSRIDAQMDFKPHFVVNHITGEREILIQDVNNVLYLINNYGRVLWKKPLKGRIVGDVTQVDYFKNGKLQMWFATPDALHLIDRNGNYVEHYPVLFPAKATNGLAVFDYENKRKYRGFIACEDHRVYAYSLDGNQVQGWAFGKTERVVSTPVQWFQNEGKDYLIFADDYRTYILDRKGNERVHLQDLTPKAKQSLFYLFKAKDQSYFLTTTPKGEILKIYMNGKVRLGEVGKFTPDHFFEFVDINGDGNNDFVFADKNELSVYNASGHLILKVKTPSDISYPPSIYTFATQSVEIGVVNKQDGHIYLYNKDGKLHRGFPLQGQTMFSIGLLNAGSSKYSLVVGGNNNYLYKYSVD